MDEVTGKDTGMIDTLKAKAKGHDPVFIVSVVVLVAAGR